MFTWLDGSPIHPLRFSRRFEQHVRRAGLPGIRLHDLRHSYASAALAAGVPAKVISERLGHATIAVTMDITPVCWRVWIGRRRTWWPG